MRDEARKALPLGALLAAGVVGLMAGPKLASMGRKAVHRATGVTFRSHIPLPERPKVDPARGIAA